jgi:prepilin-type N-terminal cleavage/methylation domain-containing protein
MDKARNGFTIIEMMIVLIIIAILAGFVFRMMTLAGQKNDIATTKAVIEKVSNALEAYRAEFGSYPPVAVYAGKQPVNFEFPVPGEGLEGDLGITSSMAAQMVNDSRSENKWNEFPVFTFGLASYFYPRYWSTGQASPKEFYGDLDSDDVLSSPQNKAEKSKIINQWTDHNDRSGSRINIQDMNKDMTAIKKLMPLLDASIESYVQNKQRVWKVTSWGCGEYQYEGPHHFYNGREYANAAVTFQDKWDRELHYQSNPPYDSYRIWSAGPNGSTHNPMCDSPASCSKCKDDIVAGQQ